MPSLPDPFRRSLIVLVTAGSHGDVHPFLGLGAELQRRGHRVVVLANRHFESLVRAVGLEFVSHGEEQEYRDVIVNPDLWHPTRGPKLVFQALAEGNRRVYRHILNLHEPGNTIVVHAALAMGARLAQEKLGVPTATVHLQPVVFRSTIRPPHLQGLGMLHWPMPRAANRAVWWLADRLVLDPLIAPGLNAFRAELSLPPVRRVLDSWWNSPDRVICLFPEWFAPVQPDWPPQTRLTNFALWDESGVTPLPDKLERFLAEGDAPIAFTPGSAMWIAQRFFSESVEAISTIGRRAVLLSRHSDHIPRQLPPNVIHVDYAPFSQLLPRCAAIVHHGGVGTSAQAMRAGIPQLIVPFSHDQPDNASRLRALGVAVSVPATRYRAERIAPMLSHLVNDPGIRERASEVAKEFGSSGIPDACDLIEQLPPGGGGKPEQLESSSALSQGR